MLVEQYGELVLGQNTERVALVLDTSESAKPHYANILNFAQQLIQQIPALIDRVYFLGNSAYYPVESLALRFQQNQQRISLITPIYKALSAENASLRVVVVGAGTIYDLHDWQATEWLQRTLLISLGAPLQSEPLTREIHNPTVNEIAHVLHDPIQSVRITGRAFMPMAWDNPQYRLQITDGNALLVAEGISRNYTLRFHYLIHLQHEAVASFVYSSGAEVTRHLKPELPPMRPLDELSPQEQTLFQQARQQLRFTCLVCGREHEWRRLRCSYGGGFSQCVYPSLEQHGLRGFVVFHCEAGKVRFEPRGSAVQIDLYAVAVQMEGQPLQIYRYNLDSRQWELTNQVFQQYLPIGEGKYVICL